MNLSKLALLTLGMLVLEPLRLLAQETPSRASRPQRKPLPYTPPVQPSPPTAPKPPDDRVGDGGARGPGLVMPAAAVLAPEHAGRTTQEQPVLFWYQNKPTNAAFEFALVEKHSKKTILRLRSEKAGAAGIKRVALARHDIALGVGTIYQWSVALVTDPKSRSLDVLARGEIERIAPTGELQKDLEASPTEEYASVYARHGLWYDAFQHLSDQVALEPKSGKLREERAELLDLVHLPAVAAAVRK